MNFFSIIVAILNLMKNPPNVKPVDNFNIDYYTGTWHQVYDNLYNQIFLHNATCINHHYQKEFDTLVHITYKDLNDLMFNKNISYQKRSGLLKLSNDTSSGQLKLSMDDNLIDTDYFVTKLGPIVNDKYEYAIVTDSLELSLRVLARDKEKFLELYDEEVLEHLNKTCKNDPVIEELTLPSKVYNTDC